MRNVEVCDAENIEKCEEEGIDQKDLYCPYCQNIFSNSGDVNKNM